jgi:hypothetical protein
MDPVARKGNKVGVKEGPDIQIGEGADEKSELSEEKELPMVRLLRLERAEALIERATGQESQNEHH